MTTYINEDYGRPLYVDNEIVYVDAEDYFVDGADVMIDEEYDT